ncbi:flagellar motor protein [uncultured Abyssibacter sp.]|uniref:flagellar motor protein n=1 Tax=uncultured Abyssibacter sp. TaxID=2320202 RepID=UPI0032B2B3B7
MDKLSIAGLLLALGAIFGGSSLKGSGVAALVSPAAFVIVIVGTVAAILVQTPGPTFRRALRMARWVFRPPVIDWDGQIDTVVQWSRRTRQHGLLGLESTLHSVSDSFTRRGLQMLVDGVEPAQIRAALDVELDTLEARDAAAAKVFEGMGTYAPTMGIIGAVMGLMAVMQNLADPDKLGAGIAAAFVATVYGIGLANLLFLPMAAKLKATIAGQSRERELMIEGLVAIADGEHPNSIQVRLQGFR